MTSNEIRQQFLDFFRDRGHAIVPSTPVVPLDDPTLLFTNAGMNQFKDVFLGTGSRSYVRVADTQKCIRAGGKHNDLDDVGRDTYHHTFFEMLGNWSFGDYFKKEAIAWAWELLTAVWKIDKSRLHATYFGGDEGQGLAPDSEARDLWLSVTDVEPTHVHPGGVKDNFWEMGETGPCGPCSEIHIDLTPDKSGARLVNAGDHRVIEIWNLVFIQFNRAADGKLTPLPAKHVDTGMGFERLCAVLLGKTSNYDTDVFAPLFRAIQERTRAPDYQGTLPTSTDPRPSGSGTAIADCGLRIADSPEDQRRSAGAQSSVLSPQSSQIMIDVSCRVIADHLRCLTFALTDGAIPSNKGRGDVLRSILRRAARYGRQYFDIHEPFLCDLVAPLVEQMASVFPELRTAHGGKNVQHVTDLIREEEESFGRTLDRGIALFENEYKRALANTPCKPSSAGRQRFAAVTEEKATGIWVLSVTERFGSMAQPSILYSPEQLTTGVLDEIYQHRPLVSGPGAFTLHDTYGFPIDLTEQMARERGLTVDIGEYERLMEQARENARKFAVLARTLLGETTGELENLPRTDDSHKYRALEITAAVAGMIPEVPGAAIEGGLLNPGDTAGIILDRTCFYPEAGGQCSDTGILESGNSTFEVREAYKARGRVIHYGRLLRGALSVGDTVTARVAPQRLTIMQNHTATHLLNWALREVLGDGVQQKGSLVDHDKTRFDFSHPKPLTVEEITRVEILVHRQIQAKLPVYTKDDADLAEAQKIKSLRAVFGEKYADRVRIVSVGANIDELLKTPDDPRWCRYAVELCGGTHLKNSAEAEWFVIVSEEAVAKGVRRVVGVTGPAAKQAEVTGADLLERAERLDGEPPERLAEALAAFQRELSEAIIPARVREALNEHVAELQGRLRRHQKEQAASSGEAVMDRVADLLASAETIRGVTVVVGQVPAARPEALRGAIDWVRQKTSASSVLLAAVAEGKVTLLAGMSKEAVARGLKAGDLIKEVAPLVGGKGGGRPDMAQGGGDDVDHLDAVLDAARSWMWRKIG